MRIFNSLIVQKNLKDGNLWDFLTFVLLQINKKIEGRNLWGYFEKKSHKSQKGCLNPCVCANFLQVIRSRFSLFRITCKKLAHAHGFEHEPSGLKSKHLTTRPRTPELCDLRAETRELSRGKKSTRTLPKHLLIPSVTSRERPKVHKNHVFSRRFMK